MEEALFVEVGLQVAAVAVLIDVVGVIGGFQDLIKSNDMVILDHGHGLDLVLGVLLQFRGLVEFPLRDDLDGVKLLVFLVEGLVDLPVLTLPDGLVQFDQVILDQLRHLNILNSDLGKSQNFSI